MTIELILSIISIIFIISLLCIRKFHLAYARGQSIFLMRTDAKLNSFWVWLKRVYEELTNDVVELVKDFPHIILNLLNKLFFRLHKKTKKLIDLIKGNRIKTDRGSVSLYLQKIEQYDSDKSTE